MRILFLGNNWVGLQVLRWLKEQREEVVGLVLHSPAKRKFGDEMVAAAALDPAHVFDGAQLQQPEVLGPIRTLQASIAISVYFGYILKGDFLSGFPKGCLNLHPAFLPYNRGAYPNVWSIIEGTPAGVTLHYVDEGVDTGDIVAQREIAIESVDTGGTLYRRLEEECVHLFKTAWPLFKTGELRKHPQPKNGGTAHRAKDVRQLDEIDLDRSYTGRELINLMRARTFPPYRGAYFLDRGRRIYVSIELQYEQLP